MHTCMQGGKLQFSQSAELSLKEKIPIYLILLTLLSSSSSKLVSFYIYSGIGSSQLLASLIG